MLIRLIIYFVTQKAAIEIMICLDTHKFTIKMVIDLVFEIDRNSINIEMILIEQVISIVHPVYCPLIFLF